MVMASNDCDDLDEDVILPNSPLYSHFREGTPPCSSTDAVKKTRLRKPSVSKLTRNCVSAVVNASKWTVSCLADPVYNLFRCQHNSVQRKYYDRIVNVVTSKSAMIPEDVSFLKAFSSELPPFSKSKVNILLWIALPSMAVALLLGSYCSRSDDFELAFKNNVTYVLGRKTVFFMASFILTFFFSYCMLSVNHRLKFRSLCKKLENLCTTSKSLIGSFKLSFKMIQEAELVARGFTASNVVGSMQRLELAEGLPFASPGRQLPEFRKILFTWAKETFILYRYYTADLIKCFPLTIDCVSSYFATTSLREFGKLLELDTNTAEGFKELLQVSDNLSLSSLKAMYQLALVQISEFLRRFCLSLYGELDHEVVNYCATFQKLEFLVKSVEELIEHDAQLVSVLKENITFYKSGEEFSINDENRGCSELQVRSPIESVLISLHNFNLHLKAALRKGISVEDLIAEKNRSTHLSDEAVHLLIETLNLPLNELKDELVSCDACLADCFEYIHEINAGDKDKQKISTMPSSEENQNKKEESAKNVVLIEDSDPVIEDEVFEAVIKDSDSHERNSEEFYDADDIVRGKFDRKTSANLMKELKTVLVAKAEEHHLREQKAIKAKAVREGVQIDESPEETSPVEQTSKNSDKAVFHGTQDLETDIHEKDQCQNEGKFELNLIPEHLDDVPRFSNVSKLSKMNFPLNRADGGAFAASIAALAAQRQKTLNLEMSTFEFEADSSDTEEKD